MSDRKCANCVYWSANQQKPEDDTLAYPCLNEKVNKDVFGEDVCEWFTGSDSVEANVPNHGTGIMTEPDKTKVDGPTEILIVTYRKDFPWLMYCLQSIRKFCSGFQGVTLAIPKRDIEIYFQALYDFNRPTTGLNISFHAYDEIPGKGMVQHMAVMANADQIAPVGTKYVLHHDADGIFNMPVTPEHFFWQRRPFWLIRTWASLGHPDTRHPVAKVVSDCAQWKPATDEQLGWDTEWYTMCVNTQAIPVALYERYRAHLIQRHRKSIMEYFTEPAARNEFPQNRMDWTAMGAYFNKFYFDRFTWFDVDDGSPFPRDRKKAFWSHGGITPEIRKELEEMIA